MKRFAAGAAVDQLSVLGGGCRHRSLKLRIANRSSVERFHGTRYVAPTRLATAAPHIAKEWDFDRNPMHVYPKIIGVASLAKWWWKCDKCEHSFSASVEERTLRGYGCPECAKPRMETSHAVENSDKQLKKTSRKLVKRTSKSDASVKAEPLRGELDPSLRPKRPPVFSLRTSY